MLHPLWPSWMAYNVVDRGGIQYVYPSFCLKTNSSFLQSITAMMETLPNELIHHIFDLLAGARSFSDLGYVPRSAFMKATWRQATKAIENVYHPRLYCVSLLNHRMRRIALPLLFRYVGFAICDNPSLSWIVEINAFRSMLRQNSHLAYPCQPNPLSATGYRLGFILTF